MRSPKALTKHDYPDGSVYLSGEDTFIDDFTTQFRVDAMATVIDTRTDKQRPMDGVRLITRPSDRKQQHVHWENSSDAGYNTRLL